ncbi:hypothetical protein ONZ51_g11947 [Trametes cubensis]|uniref:Uncharacterized protein n=1 Tax=Trametes cubensis TaxID=1111947 RepID=A0AAD7TGL2_9APHY|nr:hypothetical protein ONZ51_g11947 [Trametes cubensis]
MPVLDDRVRDVFGLLPSSPYPHALAPLPTECPDNDADLTPLAPSQTGPVLDTDGPPFIDTVTSSAGRESRSLLVACSIKAISVVVSRGRWITTSSARTLTTSKEARARRHREALAQGAGEVRQSGSVRCGMAMTATTTGTGGMIATEEGTAMDGAETATGSATQDKKTTDEEAQQACEPYAPAMNEGDRQAIRSRELGMQKSRCKMRKMNDRKFASTWNEQDDAYQCRDSHGPGQRASGGRRHTG